MTELLVERPILDPILLSFGRAKKTKPLRAKLLSSILVDDSVISKFLLDTLEGTQVLRVGTIDNPTMVCIGVGNDAWQQPQKKLFQKYNITAVDGAGWMTCEPKPENEVEAAEVTAYCGPEGDFSLVGQWGDERIVDGVRKYLQYGKLNDIVCRSLSDPTDMWIVARKMYDATYEWC